MFNKLVYVCMGIVIAGSLIFMSCQGVPVAPSQKSPTPLIIDAGKDVGKAATVLDGTTTKIEIEAKAGQEKTPAAVKPILDPHWSEILMQAGVQKGVVENLKTTQVNLVEAQKKSVEFEKKNAETEAKLKEANDGITKQLREKYMAYSGYLFFATVVALGVGFYMKSKIILGIGGILGAACVASIFVTQVVHLIPWFVVGGAVILVGVLLYAFYKKNGDLNIFKNAFKQTVEVVENAKPFMTKAGRKAVFGNGAVNGIAHSIQNDDTKTLVDAARTDIEKAPPIPGTVAADWDGDGDVDEDDMRFRENQLRQEAEAQAALVSASDAAAAVASSKSKRRAGSRKVSGPQAQQPSYSTNRILFN